MKRPVGRVAAASLLSLAVALAGCGQRCGKIRQSVIVDSPDSELGPLIAACLSHVPAQGETCQTESYPGPPITCGCLPLCQRVLEIIDQFPGSEKIETCSAVAVAVDAGAAGDLGATAGATGVEVDITYRVSMCP